MSVIAKLVEGETARLTWRLTEDGAAVDATGFTFSDLVITANDGTSVDTTGDFAFVSVADGTVSYDPDTADFVASRSPYRVRVKLLDGNSKVRYYPNGAPAEILVRTVR